MDDSKGCPRVALFHAQPSVSSFPLLATLEVLLIIC